MILLTLHRMNMAEEQSEIADNIVISALEKSVSRSDYLRTSDDLSREQWVAKSEEVGNLLKSAADKFKHPEDREIIAGISRSDETSIKLFSRIVENRQKAAAGQGARSQKSEAELIRLLNKELYDYTLNARKLREMAEGHLSSALKWESWVIIGLVALVTVAATIFSWLLGRTITSRIAKLNRGAEAIGEGNLEHRIEIRGADEFSEFAQAFNAMTKNCADPISSSAMK